MSLTDAQARAAIHQFRLDHLAYEGDIVDSHYVGQYENELLLGGRTVDYAYDEVISSMIMRALAYGKALPNYEGKLLINEELEAAFNNASSSDLITFAYPNADTATKQALTSMLDNGKLKGYDVVKAMNLLAASDTTPTAGAVKQIADQLNIGTYPSPSQVSDAVNGVGAPTNPTTPIEVAYPAATLDLPGISDANVKFLTAMYVGAFNRAPEFTGLKYWASELAALVKSGVSDHAAYVSLGQVMYQAGIENGEGGTGLGTVDFVKYAYENSLGRQPDASGFSYWQTQIDSGSIQRSDFLTTFLSAALENGVDGAYLQARVAVAKFVAQENVSGPKSPGVDLKTILSSVKDETSAKAAISAIEATYGKLSYGAVGIDHQALSGAKSDYTFTINDDFISYSSGGEKKALIGIERVDFADGTHLAIDLSGNAGQAYRLYNAAFNRTPDKEGLGYWIGQADSGKSMISIADSFVASDEFKGLYGATHTHSDFITKLYTNVLDRVPDAAGVQYWQQQIDSGVLTESQVLLSFAESAENKIAVVGQIQNGIEYSLHA